MAIIKRGILGGFSKKIGNVVGSSWKGIAVMKSLPLSVANPRTAGQVAQRSKFAGATGVASILLVLIVKPLWDRAAQLMSGYNAFVQANVTAFTSAGVLIPNNFLITIGKGIATPIVNVGNAVGSSQVSIEWSGAVLEGNQLATDDMYAVVHNVNQNNWGQSGAVSPREDEEITLTMPTDSVVGDVLEVYLAARSADGFNLFAQDHLQGIVPA